MLLFDSPNEDILRAMLAEQEKVSHFVGKMEGRVMKRSTDFLPPFTQAFLSQQYTVPASHNTYTVVSKRDKDDVVNFWVYLKLDGNHGMRKFITLKKNGCAKENVLFTPPWVLDIYTGHFLSRYRERTGSAFRTTDELFVHFLERNLKRSMALPAYFINPAISEREQRQYAVILNEGLAFVEATESVVSGVKAMINENKTFVSRENLFYKQAVSLASADFYVTRAKLKEAQKEGASAERLMEILDSRLYTPNLF